MSDGDWRPLYTLAGLVLLVWLASAYADFTEYQSQHVQERESATEHDTGAGRQQGQAVCSPVAKGGGLTCSIELEQAEPPDPYAERDLRAQQEMAEWALAMAFITGLSLLATIIGVIYVARTLRSQLDANKDARKFFAEERRAWLSVRARCTSWMIPEGNPRLARLSIAVDARNIGMTPATNCWFEIPSQGLRIFSGAELAQFRASIASHKQEPPPGFIGQTIFPSEGPSRQTALVDFELFHVPFGDVIRSGRAFIPVWVSYFYAGSDERHVTPVVLDVAFWVDDAQNFRFDWSHFPVNLAAD